MLGVRAFQFVWQIRQQRHGRLAVKLHTRPGGRPRAAPHATLRTQIAALLLRQQSCMVRGQFRAPLLDPHMGQHGVYAERLALSDGAQSDLAGSGESPVEESRFKTSHLQPCPVSASSPPCAHGQLAKLILRLGWLQRFPFVASRSRPRRLSHACASRNRAQSKAVRISAAYASPHRFKPERKVFKHQRESNGRLRLWGVT
jgi:hypothetical protein